MILCIKSKAIVDDENSQIWASKDLLVSLMHDLYSSEKQKDNLKQGVCVCACLCVKVTVGNWGLINGVSECVCVYERLISSEQWWKDFTMDLYEGFYTWSELRIKRKRLKQLFLFKVSQKEEGVCGGRLLEGDGEETLCSSRLGYFYLHFLP